MKHNFDPLNQPEGQVQQEHQSVCHMQARIPTLHIGENIFNPLCSSGQTTNLEVPNHRSNSHSTGQSSDMTQHWRNTDGWAENDPSQKQSSDGSNHKNLPQKQKYDKSHYDLPQKQRPDGYNSQPQA